MLDLSVFRRGKPNPEAVLVLVVVVCTAFVLSTLLLLQPVSADPFESTGALLWPLSQMIVGLMLVSPVSDIYQRLLCQSKTYRLFYFAIASLIYSSVLVFLSPVVGILLSRLFNFPEMLTFGGLGELYRTSWPYLLPGACAFIVQVGALEIFRLKDVVEKERALQHGLALRSNTEQLMALNYQLRPHFIFNALNNIAMLVRREAKTEAVDALVGLSTILSKVMDKEDRPLISLREELELIRLFISIQQHGKKQIPFTDEIADDCFDAKVPALILQPLLENAFKFASAPESGSVAVTLTASSGGSRLRLAVFNTGSQMQGWSLAGAQGIGLTNTIHRLRNIYGTDFGFTTHDLPTGLQVVLDLPLTHQRA